MMALATGARRLVGALLSTAALVAPGAGAQSLAGVLSELGVDSSRAVVPVAEIRSGGPPPQGIPALGFSGAARGGVASTPAPAFVTVERAATWLAPEEPVAVVSLGGESKAYPLQILVWHEIVNDRVGGVPVAVTFCPLCASALAFDRRVPLTNVEVGRVHEREPAVALEPPDAGFLARLAGEGRTAGAAATMTVTFGVSGLLLSSNLLMFDSSTATLWAQILGEGVVGTLAGGRLLRYPAQLVSFAEFRRAHPEGQVLSRDTGFRRDYGRNPYVGYDRVDSPPFLYDGPLDGRLPPKARVVVVLEGSPPVAYPYDALASRHVVNDAPGGLPVVVMWAAGRRSALDAGLIADGAEVGSVGAFRRVLDGRELTFAWRGGEIRDDQTGSSWDVLGRATSGPLAGAALTPVLFEDTFWFAFAAFRSDTVVWGAGR